MAFVALDEWAVWKVRVAAIRLSMAWMMSAMWAIALTFAKAAPFSAVGRSPIDCHIHRHSAAITTADALILMAVLLFTSFLLKSLLRDYS